MCQHQEILGDNPTGGEALGAPAMLGAVGCPGVGHQSSAPQVAPGTSPGGCTELFLSWGLPRDLHWVPGLLLAQGVMGTPEVPSP